MRFVFTAPRYHTNQHFAVKALLDAGHEVSFLVLTRGQSEEYEALVPTVLGYSSMFDHVCRVVGKCIGKDLTGIPPGGGSRTGGLPPLFTFWRLLRRLRPTVMVIRGGPFKPYGLLSLVGAKLIGAKPVLYTQIPKYGQWKRWKRFAYSLVLRVSGAGWITPVLGSPDDGTDFERLHYVPFVTLPLTSPQEKNWFQGGNINILAIGKFQPRKNHRMFLDAIHGLINQYPIRTTIIGECSTGDHRRELAELKQHCRSLGLDEKVEFKTNLPFSKVQEYYSTHDVFVLASRNERVGVSVLEAMGHSLPVICSDSNGASCYIRRGENGYVCRTDDLDDLRECMSRIVEDRKELVEMGRRSYQLVVSEHAPERYVTALLAIVGPQAQ